MLAELEHKEEVEEEQAQLPQVPERDEVVPLVEQV
jgi:hypothetical protein